jgi:hypothetical protein
MGDAPKAEFDLESVVVEDEHVERVHVDVARREHEVAAGRVPDEDECGRRGRWDARGDRRSDRRS